MLEVWIGMLTLKRLHFEWKVTLFQRLFSRRSSNIFVILLAVVSKPLSEVNQQP